ncbi:ABC transporter substrate-binding protein [Mycetocola manganoxydans]|uniref:ABC transporter substrate-binding protein n=1 Tax=Mycetocola manganoxydans TaxID=699879 RepID=A0A3L6ZZJ4_9MICO|nr:ABC transporter substrate-binding protein [Mycetocola manganoxydans]RLP73466.1 ABC transporter substrate-binding protein [Mycetocola manganoxydans]GHD41592.1 ABC transporter substrate-binding protein [Mycetocola manganoxydans]
MSRSRLIFAGTALAASALLLSGCAPTPASGTGTDEIDAATATSVADFGGLEGLVEAAEAEGELNVIALPENWANYGKIISAFEEKYDITVNSADPDVSSAEEITAAKNLKGQDTAPDVFDLGTAVALESTDHFAPYQVETWDDIPAENKEETGLWVNDYTGLMSIGYNEDLVDVPSSLDDLLSAGYKGKIAVNGDPTQAGAAFAAVGFAAIQSGGSVDDFQPGIDFFAELNEAGNFLPLDPTPATIASGETAVVFDWSYNNLAEGKNVPSWKTVVLDGPAYGAYYNQAVNADAPNPAAARLWQEFIFSDEAQNLYLEAGAYPVRLAVMEEAGTVDEAASKSAGSAPDELLSPDTAQTDAANALLAEQWAALVG